MSIAGRARADRVGRMALALAAALVGVTVSPASACADTGGETHLTVQRADGGVEDAAGLDGAQTRATVSGIKGGGLPQTGDRRPTVPLGALAAGGALALAGGAIAAARSRMVDRADVTVGDGGDGGVGAIP